MIVDGDHLGAERAEQRRSKNAGGAIGAIENDFQPREFRAGKHATPEEGQILGVKRSVGAQRKRAVPDRIILPTKDISLDFLFNGVGKFHARAGKQLHAVIVIGIVRGGNDHSGVILLAAHQAGHARSGDDTGKRGGHARLR